MLSVDLAGAPLRLLPSGAAFLPDESALLVADAHFGKALSFRRLGVPVPEATTDETLTALSRDLADTGAQRLVFLGDFLHAARGRSDALMDRLAAWRADHVAIEMTLVRGNHDDRAGDPPPSLGLAMADEPLDAGSWALRHHPEPVPGRYVLAGHWHPCTSVHGRGHDRLRLPCFWLGERVGVLPAYGSFTGMHPIAPQPGDRVFAIAGDAVREIPAGRPRG